MIVCPVCEHAQPHGGECENCGKRLAGAGAPPPPVAPLEGLERTGQAPASAGGGVLEGLEPTRHGAVGTAPEAVPGLEATGAAPVDVDSAPLPDVERTAAGIPDDLPTPLPLAVVCRYCRTPAMPGERICGRCGMRLPAVAAPASATPADDEGPALCSCGAPVRGPLCPACGARNARP